MCFRDDQRVAWCQRVLVKERDYLIRLMNRVTRYFSRYNLTEDAIIHVYINTIGWYESYRLRSPFTTITEVSLLSETQQTSMTEADDVADEYDPDRVEAAVFERWEETDAYRRTKEHRSDGESLFFVDGPPYTSGAAHMGTTWNKTLKDCFIRYHRMHGYDVTDRPGYDMHGLPIETRVEEQLGFENKQDIEEFGEQAFIEACKEYALEQLEGLQADFQDFGVWMDWDDPYKTISPTYMEAAWWGFAQAADRGLVEKGKRSISQCPRCQTAIAKNEVEYEDVEDPSIYVNFELTDRDGALVIWTTTPWTIPANAFIAVDPDLTYLGVEATRGDETDILYMAKECVDEVLKAGRYDDYEVIDERSGEEMIGWEYEHPLAQEVPNHPNHEGANQVYAADYVEADRTGLVHSAPGHGEEDFLRGSELGFPIFCPVGDDGRFTDDAGAYAGMYVKEADEEIISDLEANGSLLTHETVEHSYGHCWRCDTGIIQIVTDQWFITITDVKHELLENIEDSEWHPSWARDNRFRDFVEEAPDWNVSRQRYWGIPLPIWTPEGSDDDSDMIVIETRDELAERVDQDIDPATVDLHKDTVDELTITEGGTTYTRVPDVFDVWLDSSVATWGTLNYPEEEDVFDELWPADLIIEAHDQTRGWFWSMLGMGTAALGEIPYRQVLMHGHALMPDGRAMSKSKDILIAPHEAIDRHGRDVMRLFLLSNTAQGDDMRFSWDGMRTMENHLRTLWNVFRFPLPYMELDDIEPDSLSLEDVDEDLELADEWILSRLQSTKADMETAMDEFRQDRAVEALVSFIVEDVSRFYIQTVRERMWSEDPNDPSKLAAYATLMHVLEQVTILLAPYGPFVSERIYETVSSDPHPTVHMEDWPAVDEYFLDEQLEDDIAVIRAVEEAGANARQTAGRPRRWPIQRVVVAASDDATIGAIERHESLLADRLNSQTVEIVADESEWEELRYSADADMAKLGPAFGQRAETVMHALNEARVEEPTIEALETAVEEATGEAIELEEDMVNFVTETPPGISGGSFDIEGEDLGVVYIDATLTEELESEGYARELIRRIQEMRKELDLEIDQPIHVDYSVDDDRITDLLAGHIDLIKREVRAKEIGPVSDGLQREWEIEDTSVDIAIEPTD